MMQERRLAGLTLTRPNRLIETVLAGRFDEAIVNETARWGNALMRARDQWADINRSGRRYSDAEMARREGLIRRDGGR